MRPLATIGYLGYLAGQVWAGSWQVARAAFAPGRVSTPAIIEFPLRCRTDLQISALAASITITPGTLVLGTAGADGDTPPTLFVHALFATDRASVLAQLADMETRMLRAVGGAHAAGHHGVSQDEAGGEQP